MKKRFPIPKEKDLVPPMGGCFITERVTLDGLKIGSMDDKITRFAYRLTEQREEGIVHALHAFAIGVDSHVLMAVYVDDESDLELARQIWKSLDETPAVQVRYSAGAMRLSF